MPPHLGRHWPARPPEKVFDLVNGYRRYNEWSPWYERDPQAKYSLADPETGKGARMSWASERSDVGKGTQEIVESVPGKLVRMEHDLEGMGPSDVSFKLEPAGSGTRLTWDMAADLGGNPLSRWMGLMMDGMVGPDFEKGLASLQKVAEK